MRKRSVQYKDAFQRGLRSTKDPRNQDRLARCYNGKPRPEGLRGWQEIPQVVTQANVNFPFPQLFVGKELMLCAYENELRRFNPATGDAALFLTFDADTGLVPTAITPGDFWQFVDLGRVFMLTNGNSTVFVDNKGFDYHSPSVVKVSNDVVLGTMCAWRGRIFSAGFRPTLVWKELWETALGSYETGDRIPDALRSMSYTIDERFVMWSSVGTSDLSFRWLMYPHEAFLGLFSDIDGVDVDPYSAVEDESSTSKSPMDEMMLRNEFGMMQMPFQGVIHAVKPHALGVMVYGSEGIALLRHSSAAGFSTFGLEVISREVGIPYRSSVEGSDTTEHCFVDTTGVLHLLDKSAKLIPLGYQEFFNPMLFSQIVVTSNSNPKDPEFYICSKERGFCLTTQGLGEQFQRITSVGTFGGGLGCVSSNANDRGGHLEISDYNGGLTGMKQISEMRISANKESGILGSSFLTYKTGSPAIKTPARLFNPEGNLVLLDTGVDMRIALDFQSTEDLLVEQLNIEVAFLDKRFTRGVFVQEADQQASS